jgi:hypothetical protein
MTAKHRDPEYLRNRKIVRERVAALHRAGRPAICWRGGGAIWPATPGRPATPYDVGHVAGARGHALHELAPEHRHKTAGCCEGNRRAGGKVGAMLTNKTKTRTVQSAQEATTWKL